MCKIYCVTNRLLCREDFFQCMEKIAAAKPDAIILREKDMSPAEYRILAERVMEICGKYNVKCILHTFAETAAELGAEYFHAPFPILREMSDDMKGRFTELGTSCHSVDDAENAVKSGCTYITAGHIFQTDCKKNLAPRGLEFLENVCSAVNIPVYAIGGISADNIGSVYNHGAAGICIMSGLMICENPSEYIENMRRAVL
ncbi:MAG: thiamine phosphate synthase [Oscillospiraceae bacterium]